jgi:hypothetical protein
MDMQFKLRSGKHVGQTIGWLMENDSPYFTWIKENRPEMLKGSEEKQAPKEVKFRDNPISAMVPNMNFYNEGPDDNSLPYLKKMEEENKKNLDN